MEVMEDRKWAVGLTDEQFAEQYAAKYLHQDIPGRLKYINYVEPENRMIDPPTREAVVISDVEKRKQEVKEVRELKKKEEQVFCEGCGKVFAAKGNVKRAHKARHQKKCPDFLALRS